MEVREEEGHLEDVDDSRLRPSPKNRRRKSKSGKRSSGTGAQSSQPPSRDRSSSTSSHPLVELLRNASDPLTQRNGDGTTSTSMPPGSSLLRLLSPFRQSFEELGFLGKGGFGSVIRGRHILDNRVCAIKRIPFRSPVAPWSQSADLEKGPLLRLLREVRALCKMERSPYVTRYYWAWTEPDFQRLSGILSRPQADIWADPRGGVLGVEYAGSGSEDGGTTFDDEDPSATGTRDPTASLGVGAPRGHQKAPMDRQASAPQWDITEEAPGTESEDSASRTADVPPTPTQSYGITFGSESTANETPREGKRGAGAARPPQYFVQEASTSATGNDASSSSHATDSESTAGSSSVRTDGSESDSDSDSEASRTGKALVPVMLPADGKASFPYFLFISMEYIEGPTLDRWMASRPRVPLTQNAEVEVSVFKQLLKAILHIHMHGLIHRDIKPNNIFVVGEGPSLRVVIGDFGLSALTDGSGTLGPSFEAVQAVWEPTQRTTGIGTASYCAPEQMQGPGLYGCRVDLFPAGLILVELFTKMSTGMERARILQDARNGFLPAHLWNLYPEVGDLATRLLFSDPGSRITASQALEHPALNGKIYEGDGVLVSEPSSTSASTPRVSVPPTPSGAAGVPVRAPPAGSLVVEEVSDEARTTTGASDRAARPPSSSSSFPSTSLSPSVSGSLGSAGTTSSLHLGLPGAMPADPFENGPVFAVNIAEWPASTVREMCQSARALGCNLALFGPQCLGATTNADEVPWGARFHTLLEARESLAPSTTWRVTLNNSPACPTPPTFSTSAAPNGHPIPVWPWELVSGCFDGRNVLLVLTKDSREITGPPDAAFPFGRFVSLRSAAGGGPFGDRAPYSPVTALAALWSASQALRTSVSRASLLSAYTSVAIAPRLSSPPLGGALGSPSAMAGTGNGNGTGIVRPIFPTMASPLKPGQGLPRRLVPAGGAVTAVVEIESDDSNGGQAQLGGGMARPVLPTAPRALTGIGTGSPTGPVAPPAITPVAQHCAMVVVEED